MPGDKATITGKCCFSLAVAEAAVFQDSQISPIDKRCTAHMDLEGDAGRLGEDPESCLLVAAGQRRNSALNWFLFCIKNIAPVLTESNSSDY